jgi:hypothetical protein
MKKEEKGARNRTVKSERGEGRRKRVREEGGLPNKIKKSTVWVSIMTTLANRSAEKAHTVASARYLLGCPPLTRMVQQIPLCLFF